MRTPCRRASPSAIQILREVGLAEPATTSQRLEAMPLQRPKCRDLAGMHLPIDILPGTRTMTDMLILAYRKRARAGAEVVCSRDLWGLAVGSASEGFGRAGPSV